MRGALLAAAVLASVAACGARGAEPVERPRASGLTPADEARRNEYQRLLEGMSKYGEDLDPRQRASATPANVSEALPPVPPVLPPGRPRVRGDALELADLALQRGDALDAAAQYRAWIDGRAPSTTGYANVKLAEAYLALGQIDRAILALAEAVRSPDAGWYALARLAQLRLPTFGPLAVTRNLTLMAPSRVDDIENYVIRLAAPSHTGELLMHKVERVPRRADACGYAIAAVARGVHRVPVGLPETCRVEVERAVFAARGEPWLDARNPARRLLQANRTAWAMTLLRATEEPATWLVLAERYVKAMEIAVTADDRELASRSAGTALVNALRVAFLGQRPHRGGAAAVRRRRRRARARRSPATLVRPAHPAAATRGALMRLPSMQGSAAPWLALAAAAAAAACSPAKRAPAPAQKPASATAAHRLASPLRPPLLVDATQLPPPYAPAATLPPAPPVLPPVHTSLLAPPSWMEDLATLPADLALVDVRALGVYGLRPAPPPIAPRPPLVPRAPRPIIAGEALDLAELALARGDAFDATAQLHGLLARASTHERPYLELQLCRAYVALDRIDDAEALLRRSLKRGTASTWPAVFELATLLVEERKSDPYETWRDLAPHVPPLQADLARYLAQLTNDRETISKLVAAVPRAPRHRDMTAACRAELEAFEAKPPHGLPSWNVCPVKARSARTPAETSRLRSLARSIQVWQDLSQHGTVDEGAWLRIAHLQAIMVVDSAPLSTEAQLASWLALLAYQNAANVAANRGTPYLVSAKFEAEARAVVDRLHPDYRDRIGSIANSFMQAKP